MSIIFIINFFISIVADFGWLGDSLSNKLSWPFSFDKFAQRIFIPKCKDFKYHLWILPKG
jgi:hypothetical protein